MFSLKSCENGRNNIPGFSIILKEYSGASVVNWNLPVIIKNRLLEIMRSPGGIWINVKEQVKEHAPQHVKNYNLFFLTMFGIKHPIARRE